MMAQRLWGSKAKGRCPLEPRQRRSLWNPLIRVWKGWGSLGPKCPRDPQPFQTLNYCGSKGAALRRGPGDSVPWPYFPITGAP